MDSRCFIIYIIVFKFSAGITLTGPYYAVLDQTYQFTCTATEASALQSLGFRRNGGSACTLIYLLNSTQCRQFTAVPGYSCSCGQNGVYYMNISSVSLQDEATWDCQLSAGTGSSPTSNTISLPVYYGPFNNVTLDRTSPVTVVEGVTTGSIRCSAHCNPDCSYTWRKGSRQVYSTRDFPLGNISRGQEGDYTCTPKNTATGDSTDSQTLTVNLNWPPGTPSIPDFPSPMYSGDQQTITCTVTGGNPLANITWSCSNTSNTGSESTTPRTSTREGSKTSSLTFLVTKQQNSRQCQCRATWIYGGYDESATKTFNVYYPPNKPSITNPGSLCEGKSTSLTCSFSDPGNPPATYYWIKNTVSMATSGPYTFTPGKDDHQALIRCDAGNDHTDRGGHSRPQSDARQLSVYYKPRVTIIPTGTQNKLEGQNLSLICSADSNPDTAVLSWTFNGTSLPGPGLEKRKLNLSDKGVYTCTSRLNTGIVCPGGFLQGDSQVEVNVYAGPPTPGDLIAWSTSPGTIKLSWKEAARDGLKKQFMVEYTEAGVTTWKESVDSYNKTGGNYVLGQITGLQPETLYFIRVKSVTDIGTSNYTEQVRVLTKPSTPNMQSQSSQEANTGIVLIGVGVALIVVAITVGVIVVILFLKQKRTKKPQEQEHYASFKNREGNTYDELRGTVYQNTEFNSSE